MNRADIEINEKDIKILLKKKRQLPLILETMQDFNRLKYPLPGNKNLIFEGVTYSWKYARLFTVKSMMRYLFNG